MPLHLLESRFPERFPATHLAERHPNGLLALGGDLRPARLLAAYRHGIFPWFSEGEPPLWWAPDPRCVLLPAEIHRSRRWLRWLRGCDWEISADRDFAAVIEGCAAPREPGGGTWIIPAMVDAYSELHRLGYAHSLEVRAEQRLIGGLYGVSIGGAFFAESMYSLRSEASKVALVALALQLHRWGFGLIDVQMSSEHLLTMGARNISRQAFEEALAVALAVEQPVGDWGERWTLRRASNLL